MPAERGLSAGAGDAGWSLGASTGRHPGWPTRLGPLAVPAGMVELRPPHLFDASAWSRIRLRDQAHLENWEPSGVGRWEDRNGTLAWPSQWWALRALARSGQSLPFMICVNGDVVGQVTVGNIVRGALCSAWIGYWVASHVVRGGVATASVAMLVDHCFAEGGLHRLEATVRPENTPSLRVLAKLGFQQEGLFRRYLDVAGGWRDHYCFALTTEDAPTGLVNRLVGQGRARIP